LSRRRIEPARRARYLAAHMMTKRVKIHDGIIGALLVVTAGLAVAVDPRFVWLTAVTGLIMLSSAFTGFCPVHFLVSKALPERDQA
jgi:hypothetical protein